MSKKNKEEYKEIHKENFSFVIYSTDKVRGIYNYDSYYSVDWNTLLKKYDMNQKFKVKWYLGSKNKLNFIGENLGLLFIDFGSKINQQDSKGNNNIHNMGLVKVITKTISNNTYFYLVNNNEDETITITKPISNEIRVYFRTCDNLQFFNATNDGNNFVANQNLPNFYIKLEFEPL
jgi:hypothetical protein